jgi:hypothetical protein
MPGLSRIPTWGLMMTQLIRLPKAFEVVPPGEHGQWCCARLEEGNLLFFEETPFELPPDDVQFLLGQKQSEAGYHKNIAYRPLSDRLTGYGQGRKSDMVSHAVLSGQFALEQTFIVSKHALVLPEKAPVRVLEQIAGCPLV